MSIDKKPLITIIVAVFNGVETLQQCIDSVVNQIYQNKELIIIDGGSGDGTVDLLKSNSKKISYWISEPDKGIYNAWNKGLLQAKGEWICFLGADDFFWDDQVSVQLGEALQKVPPAVRLAYTQIMLLSAGGKVLFPVGEPWEKARKRFRQGLCLPHQGVMHRRSLFEQNGLFDESFRIGGDYEFMLRELVNAEAVFIPDIITVAMRQGGLSSSLSNSIEAMRDIRRAQKMHGMPLPSMLWLLAMLRLYIRLLIWKLAGDWLARRILDGIRRVRGLPTYWTKL